MAALKIIGLICLALACSCAAVNVSEPGAANKGARGPAYPPVIEAGAAREQAAREAWGKFLSDRQISYVEPDFEPALFTPRALPAALAGRISVRPAGARADEPLDEMKAKDLLRGFIERERAVLTGEGGASTLTLRDLSLTSFGGDANTYRAVYQQTGYQFPIANGYGELRLTISKTGALLQMSSRLIRQVEFPTAPSVEPSAVGEKMVGREFTHTSIAGQPLSYRVTSREEVHVGGPVVYPKAEQSRLALHLAYPVEVGRGTTWTVYVDAVTGQEIGVRQNFAS
jgi:hypothetical protein